MNQLVKRCAFLTTENLDGFVTDDELLYEPLGRLGWEAQPVSWHSRNVDWNALDVVLIRTPWDYQRDPDAFLEVLANIANSSARLENSLELVRWNIHKGYLRDLAARGVEIVPTVFMKGFDPSRLAGICDEVSAEEIVVKPAVGANADDTYRLARSSNERILSSVSESLGEREAMIQPFMKQIVEEGEFSLFYFGGTYSHAILKTPKQGDFRVQEEHGGFIKAVQPDAALLHCGGLVQSVITPVPLYTRIDLVRTERETFAVMEVELIEPALYFRMDPGAPWRFAKVLDAWMNLARTRGTG
jgi:hypothetical protein